jgi:hypothetical protein
MAKSKKKKSGASSFEIFWEDWPNKQGKLYAEECWNRKLKQGKIKIARDLIPILYWIDAAATSEQWSNPKYIPRASTAINRLEFLSDPPPVSRNVPADGLAPREPEAPKSPTELEGIALAKIREAEKTLKNWNRRFENHRHSSRCENGSVCPWVERKRPTIPTIEQVKKWHGRIQMQPE